MEWPDHSAKIAAMILLKTKQNRKAIRSLFYARRAQRLWLFLQSKGYKKPFWMPASTFIHSTFFTNLLFAIEMTPFVELVNRNFPNGGLCWSGSGKFKGDQATSNRTDSAFMSHGLYPMTDHFLQIDITPFSKELAPYLEPPKE